MGILSLAPINHTSLLYGLRIGQLSECHVMITIANQADVRVLICFEWGLSTAGIEFLEIHHPKEQQKILRSRLRDSSQRMEH